MSLEHQDQGDICQCYQQGKISVNFISKVRNIISIHENTMIKKISVNVIGKVRIISMS
jgi:hypothetical protein